MLISDLMKIDCSDHDLEWLKTSLSAAVELELATLPPYLTALWSINDGFGPAEAGITAVAKEEMLHMVLAGNMLRAVGGEVVLRAPTYPGHLPGGVMPRLHVPLARLTKELVENVFMVIEHPESEDMLIADDGTTYPSIGSFYDAISASINMVQPNLTGERQLSGTVGGHQFGPTDTINKMQTAILEIKEQGEGNGAAHTTSPEFGSELSHYWRFVEISESHLPQVFDMADVPAHGYLDPSDDVQCALYTFNARYSQMLQDLEAAWADYDGDAKLGRAVQGMYGLKQPAQALMQIPIPGGNGNYGPTWKRA